LALSADEGNQAAGRFEPGRDPRLRLC